MTRLAWLPAVWTLACTSPPALTASPALPPPPEHGPRAHSAASVATTPPPPESKGLPDGDRELVSAACAKRTGAVAAPCRGVEWSPAGTDATGRELFVVKLALFDGPGVGDDLERRLGGACDHYEYWLVPRAEGRIGDPELLLGVCNDGYGASGVGEDSVEVSPNTFKHSQYGGSAWRWSEVVSVSLSPLRPRSIETNGYWTLAPHFHGKRFDWDAFRGRDAWYTPYCNADGSMDTELANADDMAIGGGLEFPPDYAYASELVPAVALDPTFVESPGSVELGTCALTLDSGKTAGFLLEGTPGEPSDASLSVVAHPDGKRVFVQIRDDVLTLRPRPSFDHLELWSSEGEVPRPGAHCLPPPKARVSAFHIDVAGRVERQRGRGQAPKVSVAHAGSGVRRFVLSWPKPPERFTLVYADSDDGTALKRRFATSMLRPDNPDSFGHLHSVAPGEATCTVQGGRLEPVLTLSYVPKVP